MLFLPFPGQGQGQERGRYCDGEQAWGGCRDRGEIFGDRLFIRFFRNAEARWSLWQQVYPRTCSLRPLSGRSLPGKYICRAALQSVVVQMNLDEGKSIENLASPLYDFLPGSGNSRTALPIAAAMTQVDKLWIDLPQKT